MRTIARRDREAQQNGDVTQRLAVMRQGRGGNLAAEPLGERHRGGLIGVGQKDAGLGRQQEGHAGNSGEHQRRAIGPVGDCVILIGPD